MPELENSFLFQKKRHREVFAGVQGQENVFRNLGMLNTTVTGYHFFH
jgi:hypothetical protein